MNILAKNLIRPLGKDNNYILGGNLCNAFVIGEIGSSDDFFIVASEPTDESIYPMITGNILDSDGNLLFRLVRNILVINPGKCSRISGNQIGYEIHDSAGVNIFKVSTKFEYCEPIGQECFITTISGKFFNKSKGLLFQADSGSEDEKLLVSGKYALGFSGTFGLTNNYRQEELELAKVSLITHGNVYEQLSGKFENTEVNFEGKYIHDVKIDKCKILISEGNFILGTNLSVTNNRVELSGRANNISNIMRLLSQDTRTHRTN